VKVVEADVLSVPLADFADGPFKLVGNVPYYITTPILFHALAPPRPVCAVYLVQREVADRIVSKPGLKAYGALSVNVQAVARPAQLFRVPAGAFQPPPKVESAVIRIEPRYDPVVAPDEEEEFRRLVQDAFSMRRKQLKRVLRSIAHLDPIGAERALSIAAIDPAARPETLSPEDFARLLRAIRGSATSE
jgi:16S rRNA (adenine1518-N6/adenine1519-N6)-dimethyltransferase